MRGVHVGSFVQIETDSTKDLHTCPVETQLLRFARGHVIAHSRNHSSATWCCNFGRGARYEFRHYLFIVSRVQAWCQLRRTLRHHLGFASADDTGERKLGALRVCQ